MGHPDRSRLRDRKKEKKKEEALARKNDLNVLDLTPHNAVQLIINANAYIQYK